MNILLQRFAISLALLSAIPTALLWWGSSRHLSSLDYAQGEILNAATPGPFSTPPEFTVVTYNIGYGSGLTNNTIHNGSPSEYEMNLDLIQSALRDAQPQIVAMQEMDFHSARSYYTDQLEVLQEVMEFPYATRAYTWDVRYVPWPFWPLSAHFGEMLGGHGTLSRFPVTAHRKHTFIKRLDRPFIYNWFYLDRIAQETRCQVAGQDVVILNVHLEAFHRPTREEQARQLAAIVRQLRDTPLILAGDFNARMTSSLYEQLFVERIDTPPTERDATLFHLVHDTGLHVAGGPAYWTEAREDLNCTSPSHNPRGAIDLIFHNDLVECVEARVLSGAGTGSDHLPALARFRTSSRASS